MADTSIDQHLEAQRIAAVRGYDILDTPPDGAFDRVTKLAARWFAVPICVVSIVDEDRVWFKSRHGMPMPEAGRELGLCASAILSDDPHILQDARVDPRALANPLVAGEFGLRFYAGVPLRTHDGHRLGTLAIIDKEARSFEGADVDDLTELAGVVMDQIETRLMARRAAAQAELMAKEIDHRVMNSLQFVSGLLSMQSRSPDVGSAAVHLKQAADRVAAVAQVHRHFYVDSAPATSCIAFLARLCEDLGVALGRTIRLRGDDGPVPTAWIQSIGLLVNELVTNAAKHGEGQIDVAYKIGPDMHALSVSDEGCGLPEGFDPESARNSLGMRVVTSLVRRLNGTLSVTRRDNNGTMFTVSIPAEPS